MGCYTERPQPALDSSQPPGKRPWGKDPIGSIGFTDYYPGMKKHTIFQTGAVAEAWTTAPPQRQANMLQRILAADGDALIRQLKSEVPVLFGGGCCHEASRLEEQDRRI